MCHCAGLHPSPPLSHSLPDSPSTCSTQRRVQRHGGAAHDRTYRPTHCQLQGRLRGTIEEQPPPAARQREQAHQHPHEPAPPQTPSRSSLGTRPTTARFVLPVARHRTEAAPPPNNPPTCTTQPSSPAAWERGPRPHGSTHPLPATGPFARGCGGLPSRVARSRRRNPLPGEAPAGGLGGPRPSGRSPRGGATQIRSDPERARANKNASRPLQTTFASAALPEQPPNLQHPSRPRQHGYAAHDRTYRPTRCQLQGRLRGVVGDCKSPAGGLGGQMPPRSETTAQFARSKAPAAHS